MRIRMFMKNAEITLYKYIYISHRHYWREKRKIENKRISLTPLYVFLSFFHSGRYTGKLLADFFRIFPQYVIISGQRAG
jgi:hypothetical protein